MKNKGDGFLPKSFKREICPFCGKKGYYKNWVDYLLPSWRCMYCKELGNKPNEK